MKIKVFTLALSFFATGLINGQTVDEVINKYIEALGGAAKVSSLKSVKMAGSISTQGLEIPVTFTKLHQKGMRVDMEINGTANYRTANPVSGSVFMPVAGMTDPTPMEEDELRSSIRQMDVQGSMFEYKSKGSSAELIGKEMVDGSEAFKVKMKYKDGESATFYIDSKTYRVVKSVSQRIVNGQSVDVENSFSNFKQNADGYWFPYTITNQQGPVIFEKIETNLPMDESIFK